jgi:hypothetical protein
LRELPVESVAGRPCFIADAKQLDWAQFANQLAYRLNPVGDDAVRAYFSTLFGEGDSDCFGMDIESYKQ